MYSLLYTTLLGSFDDAIGLHGNINNVEPCEISYCLLSKVKTRLLKLRCVLLLVCGNPLLV